MKRTFSIVLLITIMLMLRVVPAYADSANFSYRIQGWKEYISQWLESESTSTKWDHIFTDEGTAYYSLYVNNESDSYDFCVIFEYNSLDDNIGTILTLCNPSQDLWDQESYRHTIADQLMLWLLQIDSNISEEEFKNQFGNFTDCLVGYFHGSSEYSTSGDIGLLKMYYSKGDEIDSVVIEFKYI